MARRRFAADVALAALAAAALVPVARAESLLDRPAPALAVSKWIVGEAPPAWKSLKGSAALLELLDPDDLVSEGLVSRTAEIADRAAARRLVVASVACGAGADEAMARAFADRRKVRWPFGVDDAGRTLHAAGHPPLPRYLLLWPDGTVAWEGSPGDLDDATLAGHLERSRLWRPEEIGKAVRPAAEAFARGRYGAALREGEAAAALAAKRRAAGLPVDGSEEKDLALVVDGMKAMAEARLVRAARLAKSRDSLEALEILERMEKAFGGTPWEARAREAREALEADKRAMHEVQEGRRLREILEGERPPTRRNLEKTAAALRDLLKYDETLRVGDRARAELARIEKLLAGPAAGGK